MSNTDTPADAVERFLKTWGANCGAPRSVFEGQLRTLLETVATEAANMAVDIGNELRAAETEVADVPTPLWPSDQRELLPRLAASIAQCAARFPAGSKERATMNACADMVRVYPVAEEGPGG